MRSQRGSIFKLKTHNKVLWGAMLGSFVLTALILEVPFIANLFGFTPIDWNEYLIAVALAITVIPIVELIKLLQRTAAKKTQHTINFQYSSEYNRQGQEKIVSCLFKRQIVKIR